MKVRLTPELASLVDSKVKSGLYQTASEVVREGLRLLKERDERQAQLIADVRSGFADVERGRYTVYDQRRTPGLARDIKARGMRRLGSAKKTPAG